MIRPETAQAITAYLGAGMLLVGVWMLWAARTNPTPKRFWWAALAILAHTLLGPFFYHWLFVV